MLIDPKKIKEWKARLALANDPEVVGGQAVARETAFEAVSALLAEREELLALLLRVVSYTHERGRFFD